MILAQHLRNANLRPRAKSCCRRCDDYAGVIARSALCDEAISHMRGIASLRPAKTMPDCARNDGVALRSRISGCYSVTKLQHGITLPTAGSVRKQGEQAGLSTHRHIKRVFTMAKVFGVHQFELKPGVRPEDFEQALRAEIAKARDLPGLKASLGKGDYGDQVGNYLLLWEGESVERRDAILPAPGQPSEERRRFVEATATLWQTLDKMATRQAPFTDYVVIASS